MPSMEFRDAVVKLSGVGTFHVTRARIDVKTEKTLDVLDLRYGDPSRVEIELTPYSAVQYPLMAQVQRLNEDLEDLHQIVRDLTTEVGTVQYRLSVSYQFTRAHNTRTYRKYFYTTYTAAKERVQDIASFPEIIDLRYKIETVITNTLESSPDWEDEPEGSYESED